MSAVSAAGREILFYSDFPFGYHNPEAEEKMRRFAARGYRVYYVEQLGIRNPRLRHLGRALTSALRPRRESGGAAPFDVVSPRLLVPRRVPGIDALNHRWLARQLRSCLATPGEALIWVRYPTPELVGFVEESRPGLVVYEVVDDHETAPGMNPRLVRAFQDAERRILAKAGVVFAWSEPIRERLSRLHPNVVLAPAAANIEAFAAEAERAGEKRTAIYAGAANFRFNSELIAEVASLLPDWRFLIAGPTERAVRRELSHSPNVELSGRFAPDELPALIARAAVSLMPYRLDQFSKALVPVKLVEYLAAGRPVVGTPIRGLREFSEVVMTATEPADFAAAIVAVAAEDSPGARRRRAERVASFSWDQRIDEMEGEIASALRH